jgi:tetratricopeptide (TPR) repeat protein
VTLIPVIGLVKIGNQAMADRYTYVPLTGLFIMIGWGGLDLTKGVRYRQIILWTAGILVIVTLAICSWFQIGYWQNNITLYEHALAVTKNNYLAHYNLGFEHYEEALNIMPDYREAIANLGAVLIYKGRVDEAIQHYRDFLQRNPQDHIIHAKLGDALVLREKIEASSGFRTTSARKANLDEAIQHYEQALQIKPDFTEALNKLRDTRRQREQIQ